MAEQVSKEDDIAELRERMRLLEARVAQVEHGYSMAVQPEQLSKAQGNVFPQLDSGLTVATVFARVAMLSFVLMGALILRLLTERHILGSGFGTLLGFVYAGHLIVLSFLPGRLGGLARDTSLFQCSGVMLALCIVLESFLRTHTFGRPMAIELIAGFATLALAVSVLHNKPSLAATAAVGSALALAGLGLESECLWPQLVLLAALSAAAAGLSWRPGWGFLRPLIFVPLLFLFAVGFWLASERSLNSGPLLTGAIIFWAAIVLQHFAAFRRLTWAATLWLPVATLWLAGLARYEDSVCLAYGASVVSGLAVGALALTTRRMPVATAGTAGVAATAAVAGAIGLLSLDASGVLCVLLGVGLWLADDKDRSLWTAGCAVFLMAASAIRGLINVMNPSAPMLSVTAGMLLAVIMLIYYLRTERHAGDVSSGIPQSLSTVILVAWILVLAGVLRTCAHRLFQDQSIFQVSQTALLSVTAIALTFWGHAGQRQSIKYIGLTCMVVSLAKVGLIDLMQLNGIPLISSVILLGLSSVAVSLILHRRI